MRQWLEQIEITQRERFFLWVPICLGLGIIFYFSAPTEPPVLMSLIVWVLAGAAVFGCRPHKHILPLVMAFFLGVTGVMAGHIRTAWVMTPMIDEPIKFAMVTGTVAQVEDMGVKKGSRVILKNLLIEDILPEQTPKKIRIRIRSESDLHAGQRIQTLASLNPPSGPVTPEAFDFRRAAFFEGIGAVGFAYRAPEILSTPEAEPVLSGLRHKIAERVYAHTRDPYAPIVNTFLTGQRSAIAEADNEAMRDSSLFHMLSISGMHVVMVAGGVFFIVRLCLAMWPGAALYWPIKKIAAIAGLASAAFYVLMVGAEIPAVRALFMTGMVMVAIMLDRSPFSMRLVALAAILILLFAPESLMGVSFQMSFAAVAGLVAFFEGSRVFWAAWRRQAGIIRKSILFLLGMIMTSIIAGTLTGLLALYHFQNFSLYGVLANMIAGPLMSVVVMPATIVTYLSLPFGLEAGPLKIMEWGVSWILATAHWIAGLPGAVWYVSAWPPISLGLMSAGLIWAMVWKGRGKIFALPVLVLAAITIIMHETPDIQISESGKVVGIMDQEAWLWVSNRRADRFSSDAWMRRIGAEGQKPDVWPKEGRAESIPLSCDPTGCRAEINGRKVAFPRTMESLREDCGWADIMVSSLPIPKTCGVLNRVDMFDVREKGSHAIWISPDRLHVLSAVDVTGQRPWTKAQTKAQTKAREKN